MKSVARGHPSIAGYPSRLGHEFAGVVRAVGEGIAHVAPGDRVFCGNSAPCGVCRPCRRGRESLCEDLEYLLGGFAEQVLVPERIAAKNLHRGAGRARPPRRRPGRAARLRRPRARPRRRGGGRPRGRPRRRLARADALRAARLRGRAGDRARPPPGAAVGRGALRRRGHGPRRARPGGRRACAGRRRPRRRGGRPPRGVGARGGDGGARRHGEPVRRLRARQHVHGPDRARALRRGHAHRDLPPRAALPGARAGDPRRRRVAVGGAARPGDPARAAAGRPRGKAPPAAAGEVHLVRSPRR